MICLIQKENEELKKTIKNLERDKEILQGKIEELMTNFGKDKEDEQREEQR